MAINTEQLDHGFNHRVVASRERLKDLPYETIENMSICLISELGEANSDIEKGAIEALKSGDYDNAKRYCLYDPCNSYLAAISCIASAYRSPMVADSVLRDAARHTADLVKRRCEARIAARFQILVTGSNP